MGTSFKREQSALSSYVIVMGESELFPHLSKRIINLYFVDVVQERANGIYKGGELMLECLGSAWFHQINRVPEGMTAATFFLTESIKDLTQSIGGKDPQEVSFLAEVLKQAQQGLKQVLLDSPSALTQELKDSEPLAAGTADL